jgi:hypothetical protein
MVMMIKKMKVEIIIIIQKDINKEETFIIKIIISF